LPGQSDRTSAAIIALSATRWFQPGRPFDVELDLLQEGAVAGAARGLCEAVVAIGSGVIDQGCVDLDGRATERERAANVGIGRAVVRALPLEGAMGRGVALGWPPMTAPSPNTPA
jgi:hypothetical protein